MNTEESKNKKTMSSKFNNSISESTKKSKTTQLFETLLGSKLILTENSNMLIEKPFTIFEILSIIRTNSQLDLKLEVIEKLKQIISKLHSNALIIVEKSVLKDDKSEVSISFMNELIDILIENSREPKLIESLLMKKFTVSDFIIDLFTNKYMYKTAFANHAFTISGISSL